VIGLYIPPISSLNLSTVIKKVVLYKTTCVLHNSLSCTMKSSVFCDIRPWIPVKVNWRIGGACCLHLHGRKITQSWNQHELSLLLSSCFTLISCLAYSSTLKKEAICFSEMTFTGLHGVISEKT
jgi:hypothetical protein